MRKIIVVTFLTMDGILQAPGGPQEDPTNGFEWGGWQFGYPDELTDLALGKLFSTPFDLLLGRRTYEIFASYWPYQDDEIAKRFNQINKYVVATTPIDSTWKNTVLINRDVVNELRKLKAQNGPALLVHGSSLLVQTMLANHLVDELHTWTYPITLGKGKKLFAEGIAAQEWKLMEAQVSKTGIIVASYEPHGKVKTGSFEAAVTSDAELERRAKWAKEEQENKG